MLRTVRLLALAAAVAAPALLAAPSASASCPGCGPFVHPSGLRHVHRGHVSDDFRKTRRAAAAIGLVNLAPFGTPVPHSAGPWVSPLGPYGFYTVPGYAAYYGAYSGYGPASRGPDWVEAVNRLKGVPPGVQYLPPQGPERPEPRTRGAAPEHDEIAYVAPPPVVTELDDGSTVTSTRNADGTWTHMHRAERRDGTRIERPLTPDDPRTPDLSGY